MRRSEVRILSGVDINTPSQVIWLGVVSHRDFAFEKLEEGLIALRIENMHPVKIDL